jgi:hypothetical protein
MKDNLFDTIFGMFALGAVMIGLLAWLGTGVISPQLGVCVGMFVLLAAMLKVSMWESGRQRARWQAAAGVYGLAYGPVGLHGMMDARAVDVTFDSSGEDSAIKADRIEVRLKRPINGHFVLRYAPRQDAAEQEAFRDIHAGAYRVEDAHPRGLIRSLLADRRARNALRLDEGARPPLAQLELRDSKLTLIFHTFIWPEDLGWTLDVAGQLAQAVELIDAAGEITDDDEADIFDAAREEFDAAPADTLLNGHSVRVVSRKLID